MLIVDDHVARDEEMRQVNYLPPPPPPGLRCMMSSCQLLSLLQLQCSAMLSIPGLAYAANDYL